jgi:uncharacterized OsmC-like protein
MATSRVEYSGNLRTTCTHRKSGQEIITDAPTDNNGKGEAFSPTDLVATAYASCMITVIGIHCDKNGHSFENGSAEVTKIMGDAPRRIARLEIAMDLSGNGWDKDLCERIEKVAEACPVAQSVHPDIEVSITYKF